MPEYSGIFHVSVMLQSGCFADLVLLRFTISEKWYMYRFSGTRMLAENGNISYICEISGYNL